MKSVEDPRRADGFGEMVTVEVGPRIPWQSSESELDAHARQIFLQLFNGSSCTVIQVRDRFAVNDDPAHGCRRRTHQPEDFVAETACVCVEKRGSKSIHHKPRRSSGAWIGGNQLPYAGLIRDHNAGTRMVDVVHNTQQRKHHRQNNALLYTRDNYDDGGSHGQRKLARTLPPDAPETIQFDQANRDQEDQSAEYALRKELQRFRQK